tara:strand:+ start:3136 stop:3513 length:378 start_codon:yes stop_codon:yes gene_type:complete
MEDKQKVSKLSYMDILTAAAWIAGKRDTFQNYRWTKDIVDAVRKEFKHHPALSNFSPLAAEVCCKFYGITQAPAKAPAKAATTYPVAEPADLDKRIAAAVRDAMADHAGTQAMEPTQFKLELGQG